MGGEKIKKAQKQIINNPINQWPANSLNKPKRKEKEASKLTIDKKNQRNKQKQKTPHQHKCINREKERIEKKG